MQSTPTTAPPGNNDDIDLLALLGALIDHKAIIIACTAIFAVIGIAYAVLSTPIYQATTMIQVEDFSST